MKRACSSLLAMLVALPLAACAAQPTIVPGKPLAVKARALPPYQFIEECGKLQAGDRIAYEWEAQAPLKFNIHYHEGKAVIMPVTRDDAKADRAEFKALVAHDYCLMWEAGAQGTLLDYRVRLIRDRK